MKLRPLLFLLLFLPSCSLLQPTQTGTGKATPPVVTNTDSSKVVVNKKDSVITVVILKRDTVLSRKLDTVYVPGDTLKLTADPVVMLKQDTTSLQINGSDQTLALNNLLKYTNEVVFNGGNVSISGVVNGGGKTLVFKNNAQVTGTGTITNAIIECPSYKQCFGASVTVTNLLNTFRSVAWFGAKADGSLTNGTDNYPAFVKAINSMPTAVNGVVPKIFIPGALVQGNQGNFYYLSQTLVLDKRIELYGEGSGRTTLVWTGKAGIVLSGGRSYLHDLTLRGAWGQVATAYNSDSQHGLNITSGLNVVERVVVNYFAGDGIHVAGDVNVQGNANLNRLRDFESNGNGRHGLYAQGGDANACTFENYSCVGNARWGDCEVSFLGNTHIGPHSASNALLNILQKTYVYHSGKLFSCLVENCINIEPEVTTNWQNYWAPAVGSPVTQLTWTAGVTYQSGGDYYASGANQQGVFLQGYKEEAEITINNSNSLILGGFMSNHGTQPGSIGVYQGLVATRGLQIQASTNAGTTYLQINPNNFRFGSINGANWFLNFDQNGMRTSAFEYRSPASTGIASSAANGFGRHINDNQGAWAFPAGVFFKSFNTTNYQKITSGWAAPVNGDWNAGDVVINTSGDLSISKWRCVSASVYSGTTLVTPARFAAERSGGFLKNYTPTSVADANLSEGELSFDAEYIYIKTGGIVKQVAISTFNPH